MSTNPVPADRLLLRPSEVADSLGIGRSKTYALIAAGTLPSIKVGASVRVPVAELRAWIEQQSSQTHCEHRPGSLRSRV